MDSKCGGGGALSDILILSVDPCQIYFIFGGIWRDFKHIGSSPIYNVDYLLTHGLEEKIIIIIRHQIYDCP